MIIRRLYTIIIYSCFTTILAYGFGQKSFLRLRSQSVNLVRFLVNWQQQIFEFDDDLCQGTCAVTFEYDRTLRPSNIAQFIYGAENAFFSGSQVNNRGAQDILADYFGLPPDFVSFVNYKPRITSFIIDFQWFQYLDAICKGLYFAIHLPLVHAKWDPGFEEKVIQPGTAFFPAGYMGKTRIKRDQLPPNATEALRGNTRWGDMREPLRYGKIFNREHSTRVSDIQIALGWRFLRSDSYHVGVSLFVAAPTGTKPNSDFLFEAKIGNGHHWELGAGLSAHADLWTRFDYYDERLAIFFESYITHLFDSTQMRSYDFKNNGAGNRYMLMEEIASPSTDLFVGNVPGMGGQLAPNQYTQRLVPAINFTTLKTKISIDLQADIVLKLAYQRDGFEVDVGYNFWALSHEKLKKREQFVSNRFALKGDAQLYGFTNAPAEQPIALNTSQHEATLQKGQGMGNANFANANVDNPALAANSTQILNNLKNVDATALGIAVQSIRTSNPPILLQNTDILESSALLPRAISHKAFAHIGCSWCNDEGLDPYLGIGGALEWATMSVTKNSAIPQFAVWAKGGFSY